MVKKKTSTVSYSSSYYARDSSADNLANSWITRNYKQAISKAPEDIEEEGRRRRSPFSKSNAILAGILGLAALGLLSLAGFLAYHFASTSSKTRPMFAQPSGINGRSAIQDDANLHEKPTSPVTSEVDSSDEFSGLSSGGREAGSTQDPSKPGEFDAGREAGVVTIVHEPEVHPWKVQPLNEPAAADPSVPLFLLPMPDDACRAFLVEIHQKGLSADRLAQLKGTPDCVASFNQLPRLAMYMHDLRNLVFLLSSQGLARAAAQQLSALPAILFTAENPMYSHQSALHPCWVFFPSAGIFRTQFVHSNYRADYQLRAGSCKSLLQPSP